MALLAAHVKRRELGRAGETPRVLAALDSFTALPKPCRASPEAGRRRPDRRETSSGLTAIERSAVALRVAILNRRQALAAGYRERLRAFAAPARLIGVAMGTVAAVSLDLRQTAIFAFVEVAAGDPRRIRNAHLRALAEAGLATGDIAALGRLVAFVAYEANLLGGGESLGVGRVDG